MKTICRMLKRDSKGFTLVELMVVLLIIGILVAIAIPIYINSQENAKKTTCEANKRTIEGAVAQYCTEMKKWPQEGAIDNNHDLIVQGYLKSPPECPITEGFYSLDDTGNVMEHNH